ncbi:MAG: sensor domain-containing diguanylate cyclase [Myxococcales bacterium]|nr:sensor domain-containing diguanylate cyclase [Myxococcales bacterium]
MSDEARPHAPSTPRTRPAIPLHAWGRRLLHELTFLHTPIRRKFALFSAGTSFWFLVLGFAGAYYAPPEGRPLIIGALVVAHLLLLTFTYSIARSLTQPIGTMIEQIRVLTGGDLESLGHITVASRDEVGELSTRFNSLLDALREVDAFRKVIDSDATAGDVYQRLASVFDAAALAHRVFTVDPGGVRMSLATAAPDAADWCSDAILESSDLCRARRTGATVSSLNFPGVCNLFSGEGRHHICLPLRIGGTTGGVVQFVAPAGSDPGTFRAQVASAERFVREALPVLDAKRLNEALKDSAMRDPLTGLYNRRFLEALQVNLVAMTKRRRATVGVLLVDVDHFKAVNDQYGHPFGDVVLKGVAAILVDTVRAADIVIRFGGEEFLVVLQETLDDQIGMVAERIRMAIERHEFAGEGIVLKKTISIGAGAFPKDSESFWQCVKQADQALYAAKASGRNRVVRWSKEAVTTGDVQAHGS